MIPMTPKAKHQAVVSLTETELDEFIFSLLCNLW